MKYHVVFFLVWVNAILGQDIISFVIDASQHNPTAINPRFASYSFEYGGLPGLAGTTPNVRPWYLQLMNNIKAYTGASPQFRIGGNSADRSWWNPENNTLPPWIDYSIEPSEILTINDICEQLDTVATLSINFLHPWNTTWATDYMQAVQKLIGWDNIYAIEIGNEVDLFQFNGIRQSNYTYGEYKLEWENYAKAISPYIPKKSIQGAVFCCEPQFYGNVSSYAAAEQPLLRTISVHNYPLSHCHLNPPITLLQLLEDRSSIKQAEPLEPMADAVIAQGLEFWIGEMNSVSCAGAPNISDVFGAALWTVDMLFNWARIGVKGVNFHGGPTGWYTSIGLNATSMLPEVRPLYYGQYLFAQAIKSNSALISSVHTAKVTNSMVKVWPVVDLDTNETRVVVIHKDIEATIPANVTLQLADTILYSNNAEYITVTAPSAYSQYGIQIGGLTFDGTTTGEPSGTPVSYPVLGANNVFSFMVQPGTMVLLTLRPTN